MYILGFHELNLDKICYPHIMVLLRLDIHLCLSFLFWLLILPLVRIAQGYLFRCLCTAFGAAAIQALCSSVVELLFYFISALAISTGLTWLQRKDIRIFTSTGEMMVRQYCIDSSSYTWFQFKYTHVTEKVCCILHVSSIHPPLGPSM